MLQQVADRLRPLVRETDTIARLGGDEFAIIQTDVKSIRDSEALSERIIAKVSEPYALMGAQARIGVSIGLDMARDEKDGKDLAARADFALYEAKDAGRNCYRVFDEKRSGASMVIDSTRITWPSCARALNALRRARRLTCLGRSS